MIEETKFLFFKILFQNRLSPIQPIFIFQFPLLKNRENLHKTSSDSKNVTKSIASLEPGYDYFSF